MTAIAGCVAVQGSLHVETVCRAMLRALPAFGDSNSGRTESSEGVCFGRSLSLRTPEDRFDHQPLLSTRYLVVADVRLDNRDELAAALYGNSAAARRLSDSDMILAAWEKWQHATLDHLVGDFALAVYDRTDRSLTLARDPTGQRPLFYSVTKNAWLFGSMPSALLASDLVGTEFDQQWLNRRLLGFADLSEATWLSDVKRITAAKAVRLTPSGTERRTYWQPPSHRLELSDDEFTDAYEEQLDRAVVSRLRRDGGAVAVQLSAGFDSSAVTAAAAKLSPQSPPIAFTGAPRKGFNGLVPPSRIADESGLAALTAARYGLEHHVVRTSGHALALLKRHSLTYQEPDRNVINIDWWNGTLRAARERGAKIMLTGILGNATLNWGGLPILADWLDHGGIARWFREARQVRKKTDARWTGVLFSTFGSKLSGPAVALLSRAYQHLPTQGEGTFVRAESIPQWRKFADQDRRWFASGDVSQRRVANIHSQDLGLANLAALEETGVDERDPTSDRRVVEFSFRLPPGQLLKDGVSRPLMRRALARRLPEAVLNNPLRGLQGADWYEQLDPREITDILDEVAQSPGVNSVLDLNQIREAVKNWPSSGWETPWTAAVYRRSLTLSLSTAVLINEFEQLIRSREFDRLFGP